MSRFLITLIFLLVAVAGCIAQDKRAAVKVLELPKLTSSIAQEKLEPIWKEHKCDDPEVFYIINYGSKQEIKRRVHIVVESIGRKCDTSGFRVVYIDADRQSQEPLTVVWRTWPGGEIPKP